MKMYRVASAALVVSVVCSQTMKAQYLDPGTGSFILQILLAAGLASLFYIKRIIAFIKGYIKGRSSKPSTEEKKKDE